MNYIKKKTSIFIFLCIIINIFLSLIICFSPHVRGETSYESFPELAVGDYFKYEVVERGLIDFVGRTLSDDYIGYENENFEMFKFEITKEDKVTVNGENHDCIIASISWKASFTLKFKEGSTGLDDDKLTILRDYSSKDWWTKKGQNTVKEESTNYIKMSYKYDGEDKFEENEESTRVTYKIVGDDYSFPLKIGKTWSSTTEKIVNTTVKYRTDEQDWDEYSEESNETKTTENKIISEKIVEVPAGKFKCLKMKSQEQGVTDYSEGFIDKNGILVKMFSYENNMLSMTINLIEYKMKNEIGKNDDGFEFSYFIPIMGVIIFVAIISLYHYKKSTENYEFSEDFQEIQAPQYVQTCPRCTRDMAYVEEYHDYYCWECDNYLSEF